MRSTAAPTEWLAGVPGRSGALLLEGPAGIGKTHLCRELVDRAVDNGYRVLRAQPAQAEVRLVGSALIDLCEHVADEEIATLPGPQADALSAALLRRNSDAAHPQAVSLAFATLLRRLAERRPVVVCVDDVQWLDAQTGRVLAFAARRLPPAGAGLLLSVRTEPGVAPSELITDLDAALDLSTWQVQPMANSELAQLLRDRFGGAVSAGVLRSAVAAAGGNPLYGLEVARAMVARGVHSPFDAVPVPESLADLVDRQVIALPQPTRAGLAAAAAMRRPSLHRLGQLGVAESLDAAERAGLIRTDGRTLVFTHPLYAAASYDALTAGERMRLHARLAAVVQGEEERARHLALAADEPDDAVAAALDRAREHALRRGAVDAALDAAALALRATPEASPAATDRRIHLGQLLFRAGETDRARGELTLAADGAADGTQRARALHAMARVINDTEGSFPALRLEMQALELVGADEDLAADVHMGIAVSNAEDWSAGLKHARIARELLERSAEPDRLRLAAALTAEVGARFYSGGGADIETCRRAVELQGDDVSVPVSDRALSVLFYLQMWSDDFTGARAQMQRAYELAVEEGDEPSRCYILLCQAMLELRAGRWVEAESLRAACMEASRASQNAYYLRWMDMLHAWLCAFRGELDIAVAVAEEEIERGVGSGNELTELHGRALRGWCALAAGDAERAAVELGRYRELLDVSHTAEPALALYAGDHVEALVATGRLADAERALARMVEPATRLGRAAVLAAAARAEALLRAEQGNQQAAVAAAERAVGLYATIERRFEHGRALLTKGQVHRRFKQKALARQELSAARDVFAELGARGPLGRADAELARVGLRAPAAQDLTETERRVADLAARGMTSAEIGQQLFLSTKTVSANLTRIYRKLNVRNRAELSSLLTSRAET